MAFFFFFARAALVSVGKNIIFHYNNGIQTETWPTSSKTKTIFRSTFSHGVDFLNEAEKEINNGKGN